MKIQLLYCLVPLTIAIFACSEEKEKPQEKSTNNALIIGDPMDCGLDSISVFPVGASYNPKVIGSDDRKDVAEERAVEANQDELRTSEVSFSANTVGTGTYMWDTKAQIEYTNQDEDNLDIRNLVFYNFQTGKTYPLVEDTIHILSFAIHREYTKPMIFYRIVHRDYNRDGKFDGNDPVSLYISNLDGTDFVQITPSTEHFIDYSYYPSTQSLLIKTAIDSNKDLKFLVNDETNFRRMDLLKPAMAKNIFDDNLKNTLRGLNH